MLNDVIERYQIPTQSCVLSHVTTTLRAIEAGSPVDLVFQSIAGTEQANANFGVNLKLLEEAHAAALDLNRGTVGSNCMYFETIDYACNLRFVNHRPSHITLLT
ncbi:ethanolamine ammonia-lyase, large subunit [methanotrophic bacterial endosymbiont of Bathymodiolus sp.]|nr:ethanolamine ammonia-lyase, large subunit [methanotrophic bacterial endosymbiont of Bathymodiolus sp.]